MKRIAENNSRPLTKSLIFKVKGRIIKGFFKSLCLTSKKEKKSMLSTRHKQTLMINRRKNWL